MMLHINLYFIYIFYYFVFVLCFFITFFSPLSYDTIIILLCFVCTFTYHIIMYYYYYAYYGLFSLIALISLLASQLHDAPLTYSSLIAEIIFAISSTILTLGE